MSADDLNDFILFSSKEPSIKWSPEDYNFATATEELSDVWYYNEYELRYRGNDYWLCRRRVKGKMLVKWLIKIPLEDKDFADVIFSKGLR